MKEKKGGKDLVMIFKKVLLLEDSAMYPSRSINGL